VMEVSFPQFGRTLQNPLTVYSRPEKLVPVRAL
jgi:hypothetical protein